jgi:hypothetical protein
MRRSANPGAWILALARSATLGQVEQNTSHRLVFPKNGGQHASTPTVDELFGWKPVIR